MACFVRTGAMPEPMGQDAEPTTLGQEIVNLLFSETGSAPTRDGEQDVWGAADSGDFMFLRRLKTPELLARNAHGDTILHLVPRLISSLRSANIAKCAAKGHLGVFDIIDARKELASMLTAVNNYNETGTSSPTTRSVTR